MELSIRSRLVKIIVLSIGLLSAYALGSKLLAAILLAVFAIAVSLSGGDDND